MRIRKTLAFCVAVGVTTSFVAAPTPASAVTALGAGNVRGFQGVQVVGLPDAVCTTSAPFEPMPGMTLKVSMKRRGRLVLMFQGQFGGFTSTPGARAVLRMTVDGVVAGSAIAIAGDHGTGSQTFGFNSFTTTPLGVGTHTVNVLWHTFPGGGTSCVEERSLIVLHP
jgi:hypothetical protein